MAAVVVYLLGCDFKRLKVTYPFRNETLLRSLLVLNWNPVNARLRGEMPSPPGARVTTVACDRGTLALHVRNTSHHPVFPPSAKFPPMTVNGAVEAHRIPKHSAARSGQQLRLRMPLPTRCYPHSWSGLPRSGTLEHMQEETEWGRV